MFYYIYGGWSFFFVGVLWASLMIFLSKSFIISFDWGSVWSVESWDMLFFFDFMGCSFLAILSFMVSGVYFFSYYYMQNEVNKFRFFWVVFLFVLSMYMLVVSPKMVFFLLGWDGLGFTSFLLVAWFGCFSSRSASVKTYLINRFGDALFLLSMSFLLFQGHFNIFAMDFYISWFMMFFLVLGSFTKSAQFPFSSWLPAAMAAPTPVSSLVHSSTLVTAGMYFLIRFSSVLSSSIMLLVGVVGMFTMFFASLCAVLELDVKKVVAFSTLSQLGFMCFCVSVNLMSFSFFYLLIHACFKALMFISVGVFMLCGGHSQDIRSLKGIWYFSPLVFINLFVSVVSLSGFPFLSGFMLKDLIIYSLDCGIMNVFCSFLFSFSVVFTSLYSFRLFFLVTFMDLSYLVVGNSLSVGGLTFFPLYVCSVILGFLFESFNLVFMNVGSLVVFMLFFFISVGVFISFFSYIFYLFKSVYIYSIVCFMFFCYYINISFKGVFSFGSSLFHLLDQGLFSLNFADRLGNMFTYIYKGVFNSFYSIGWLSLILFSYLLLMFLFLV